MRFQITCSTIPYSRDELPLARALAGIAAAGYGFVSVTREHPDGPLFKPGATHSDLDALRDTISSHGLQCRHAYFGQVVDSPDVIEGLDAYIESCAYVGIKQICVWGPWPFEASPDGREIPKASDAWDKEVEGFFTVMRRVLPDAENAGVELGLKPHRGVGRAGESLRETHQKLGSPAFGICYDAGNVHFYEGLDPKTDVKHVADLTTSFIAKEHVGGQGNPVFGTPGDGDLDLESILMSLAKGGFAGPVVNERVDVLGADNIDYENRRAFAHLESICKAVERHTDEG